MPLEGLVFLTDIDWTLHLFVQGALVLNPDAQNPTYVYVPRNLAGTVFGTNLSAYRTINHQLFFVVWLPYFFVFFTHNYTLRRQGYSPTRRPRRLDHPNWAAVLHQASHWPPGEGLSCRTQRLTYSFRMVHRTIHYVLSERKGRWFFDFLTWEQHKNG